MVSRATCTTAASSFSLFDTHRVQNSCVASSGKAPAQLPAGVTRESDLMKSSPGVNVRTVDDHLKMNQTLASSQVTIVGLGFRVQGLGFGVRESIQIREHPKPCPCCRCRLKGVCRPR